MPRSRRFGFRLRWLLPLLLAGAAAHLFGYALENENPWPNGTIQMELQLGDSPAPAINGTLTDGSTSWNQVALAALNDWNQYLENVQFSGVMNSTAPKGKNNGYNNVFFSSTLYGDAWGGDTVAETLIWTLNKTPVECDVLFNTNEQWDSYRGNLHYTRSGNPINDLKRVALHEFGHVLGLDHPDTAGQTVSAIMNSVISDTDDLTADDIAGVESLYGAVQAAQITLQPAAATVAAGQTAVFNVSATGSGYQWTHSGAVIAGATDSILVLNNVSTTDAGGYVCTVTNGGSSVTSIGSLLTVSNSTDPGHLVNLSIRTNAGSGDQTLIAGFVVSGSGGEPLLIRATGPALTAFGVTGVLADPVLNVYQNSAVIATDDNWGGSAQITAIDQAVGAFPLTDPASKDAAIYNPSLPAGVYTAQVTGNGGGTGIALAEIYDATPAGAFNASAARLVNVSARAQVGTGANILIAGFVISGSTAKTVLIRATGPALTAYGVSGVLADPLLRLYNGSTLIATNDNWGGDPQIAAVSQKIGAFALTDPSSKDAALLVTLPPGVYTAQVSGVNGGTGVALVEIYDVP